MFFGEILRILKIYFGKFLPILKMFFGEVFGIGMWRQEWA